MPMNPPMSVRPTVISASAAALAVGVSLLASTAAAIAQVGTLELGGGGLGTTNLGTTSLGTTNLGSTSLDETRLREVNMPRRRLARFDFEENEQFPIELPAGWARVLSKAPAADSNPTTATTATGAPDLPDFGSVKSERATGRGEPSVTNNRWALHFALNGASMAVSSTPEKIQITPGAQLTLTAWTRTRGLRHAGARVAIQYHDAAGKPLGAPHTCAPMRSEGVWRELRVEPPVAPESATSASVWLEVVQPKSLKDHEEARFQIVQHDVGGSVHFDDIEVWQLPTASFRASGIGVVEPGVPARLEVRCSDPAAQATSVAIRVRDASDRTVYTVEHEVPATRPLESVLPVLPTGWYEAEARFSVGNEPIAFRRARFAVLPNDPFEPDEPPRFGASLGSSDLGTEAAVELARAAFVVLPIWEETTDTRTARLELQRLRTKVSALLDRRIEPMFRIQAVPDAVARDCRIEPDDTLALFALDENRWRPVLEPWLLAFGQQVEQWFVADEPVEAGREGLPARIDTLSRVLGTSIAGPAVGVPWWPGEALPADIAGTIDAGRHTLEIVADASWRESAGEIYEGFPRGARGMVRIVPLPPGVVDDRERAIDIGLRAIDAWRAGFDSVSVDVRSDALPPIPGPPLELAAWRQVSTRLCGRRFIREIPAGDGVRAILGDGPRGTVLVVWRDGVSNIDAAAAVPDDTVTLDLGATAVDVTDLWGRMSRVEPTRDGHRIALGREVVFVEGVEREMLELRAGFRVDPGFATARRAAQEGALVVANPWPTPMSGTLTIIAPDELGMSPKVHRFTAPAGGEARLPVSFSVPRRFESGPTVVRAVLEGETTDPFRATLEAPLEVGFREVSVEHSWRLARSIESGAVDLILTLRVTNVSEQPIDVEAYAVADGYTQNKKPISALAPGATAVRVFPFADGVRRLSGRDIRAGVHDADGDARTLRRIVIPALLPPQASVVEAGDEAR